MKYFITINNETVGPMTIEQMMVYPVNANTPVCAEGGEWKPLYAYPDLMAAMQYSGRTNRINSDISSKRRSVESWQSFSVHSEYSISW